MAINKIRVLAVDDNPGDILLVKLQLQSAAGMDFEVSSASCLQEALDLLAQAGFAVVLLDLNLPDSQGLEGIDKILATPAAPPVIVMTGLDNQEIGLQAVSRNAQDYLIKGSFDKDVLVRSIRYAIQRDQSEKAMRQMNADLERRVAEQTAEMRTTNRVLEQRVAERTTELQVANESLRASRLAALNIMEDALAAHAQAVNDRERLQALMEALPVGVAYQDKKGSRFETNQAFEQIWGSEQVPSEILDDTDNYKGWWADSGQPIKPDEWASKRAQEGETVVGQALQIERFDGTRAHILNNAAPVLNEQGQITGSVAAMLDISELKRQEDEILRLNRTLRALSNTNQAMIRATGEQEYLDEVCRIVVRDCGHAMVWIGYKQEDAAKTVLPMASAGFEEGYLGTLKVTWADDARGRGPTGTAIRSGQPSRCQNMLTDPNFAPWRAEALKRGYASSLVLPLLDGQETFGAITIYARQAEGFTDEEEKLLSELAGDLAFGILALRTRAAHALAEEALRASEEQANNLVKYAPAAIYEMDFYGRRFLNVNDTACEWSGYSRKELLALNPMDITDDDSRERFAERIRQKSTGGEVEQSIEYRMLRKDGQEVNLAVNVGAFTYKDGKAESVLVVAHNITERKKAEETLRKSEERYRTLFNGMTEGFALHEIICDENDEPCDYRFLDINPAFERLTGLKRAEVVGKLMSQVPQLEGEDPKWVETYGKVALTGAPVSFENYSPALKRDYEVFAYQPAARQFAVIFLDVSERKRAEAALRESELRFRLALRHAPVTIATQDRELRFTWAYNQRTVDPNLVIGKTDADLFPAEDAARLVALKRKVLESEKELSEQLWVRSAGQKVFLDLFIEPLRDAGGQVSGVGVATVDLTPMKLAEQAMGAARDELDKRVQERTHELLAANQQLENEIGERIRTDVALRESENRYRTLFETSPDAVMLVDTDNKIIFANQQAARMHGYRQTNRLVGMNVADLIAPEDRQAVHESILKTSKHGALREIEYQVLKKDASRFPAEMNVTAVCDEQGKPIGFLMDIRDITERKWAEQSLRLANAYNRSLIETSLDPLVTITPDGKIGDVNTATEKVTGYGRSELIGTDFHSYFSDPVKARLGYTRVFENGSVRDFDLEIRHKDGSLTPVLYNASIYRDESGNILGAFAIARDITDRKQFETQLVQAEKHAVIGRMVGSITHEINNPLQTIKNCLYLIQQDVTAESPIHEPLEMVTSETLRLTNLVGQLRELYRPKAGLNKQSQEVLDILEEAHALLIPHLNNARVEWQPLTGLQRCYINCVRDQILEVFLNISVNAIEAMQHHGGKLCVDMKVSDEWVNVIFKDTGPGIPKEILPHLFEPFMTSKASGLGLGLSITYGIIQRHGGQIQVDNQPGQGASFTISLPLKGQSGSEENENGNQ